MQKLSKKETILREKDEAERAEAYAKKQRRQYRLRFGAYYPLVRKMVMYIILAVFIFVVFFTGYIMGEKECKECSVTILPCELPKTGGAE